MSRFATRMVPYRARPTMCVCVSRPLIWRWRRKPSCKKGPWGDKLQLVHAIPSRTWALLLSWFLFALGIGLYLQNRPQTPPGEYRRPHRTHRSANGARHLRCCVQARGRRRAIHRGKCESAATLFRKHALERHQGHLAPLLVQLAAANSRRHPWPPHGPVVPYVGVFFSRFVLFFDKIVALSLLPILFIAFGIDELSKSC